MNENGFDIGDILGAIRRRFWLLAVSVVVITPIVLVIALLLPPYYSSTARILVQSQQIPSELVRSTVQVAAGERLALIQQRLTTRENLLAMADRLQIYENNTQMSRTDIVAALRESIEVEEILLRQNRNSRAAVQAAAFTVTYSARSPVMAARVANELVTMVLQENLENRSRRASDTRQFLDKKTRDLANAINQIEAEIATFKAQNAASLPTSLSNRQGELRDLRQQKFELEGRKVMLEEQLSAYRAAVETGVPIDGSRPAASASELELEQMRRKLAQARGVYSEAHPTIRGLLSRIESMEAAMLAEKLAAVDDAGPTTAEERAKLLLSNQERNAALTERQLQLVDRQISSAESRIEQLIGSIDRTPDTEIALAQLQRRSAELVAQHKDASRKSAVAADGEELEVNRQAERYEIIEQAQIPEQPDSPPRKLIAAGGFGGSIAIGLGLMFLLEFMNRSIYTSRQLARQVGLEPIVTIPLIRTPKENVRRRVMFLGTILGLGGIAALMGAGIHYFVTPIDTLVTNLLDDANLTPIVEQARERFSGTLDRLLSWLRTATGGLI